MKTFSRSQHRDALIRRRIKFVVEKGAMARLFCAGHHEALQDELFRRLRPSRLTRIRTQRQYDSWLNRLVRLHSWARYSRNGLAADRWAYFAKLVNIVVYEIVTNRELVSEHDWKRLREFLHVPIDATVLNHLSELDQGFQAPFTLKGMRSSDYRRVQAAVRKLASAKRVPPIWFEAAWSA